MSQLGANGTGRLLTIGQVTALTGVRRSTIRHWERHFEDFLASVRTSGNQRRFTPESIHKIEKIKSLVEEQGLTLEGVRRKLETSIDRRETPKPRQPEPEPDMDDSLQKLADMMSEHMIRRLFHD